MTTKISIKTCRRRLALIWFAGGLALFLLLVIQSLFGKYGARVEEAWAWFLPNIMPTLSLIISVLVLDATTARGTDKKMERLIFQLAFGLSALYLALLGLVPLIQPLTDSPTLDLMKRSCLWLGPLQGLVAAGLGAFFVIGERGVKEP